MRELVVRTRQKFPGPASTVWSLICNSRMDGTSTLLFRLGVPQPVECRVPDSRGGVGSERECVSDQGVVHQRILEWVPEKRLRFRMERTDLRFQRYVSEIVDTFDFDKMPSEVRVTRTTEVGTKGRFQFLKKFLLYLSLKQVHRYVFRNWHRLAEREISSSVPTGSGSSAPHGF
jgi:hypothetical protein